jgi:aryl-alcohol dehydrogenase-like predicted oxidoreductase
MKNWIFHDGQTVNRLGFGAMRLTGQPGNWGPYPDKQRAARVFRLAVEMGVNFIDTAISYGAGHSEMLIAEILHPYPKGLMIATKGGIIKTGPAEIRMDGSPSNLRSSCESSLSYLKIDCIDLYQYHYVDPKIPLEDSIGALVSLKNEGKIRHIGLCNVSVDQIKKARDITPIASVQNRYNVSDRAHEDVLKYCVAEGIAFICYGPFNAEGFVQGAPLAGVGSPFEPIAKRLGVTAGQVALAWLLQLGPNVIPIPGTTSPEHLTENVAARDIELSPKDISSLL